MMNPKMTVTPPNTLQQQASHWVTRIHSSDCTDAERYAFDKWLAESKNHRIAYQQVLAFWQQLAQIEPHANTELEAARAYLRDKRQARRQFSGKRATTVLSLLLVMSASPFFWSWINTQNYHTAKGEHTSIALSDGSHIELNTDTELSVQYTDNARSVKLHHGEALFTVIHNSAKPFAVTAANGVITDIGTRFNVYQQASKVSVTVLEGEVSITTTDNPTPHTVKPNQQLSYDDKGQITPIKSVDINTLTAWQKKQLVFKGQALIVVVEQLARYHDVSLQIADPRLQALKVSGSFPSDDLPVALNTIANALPIKITSTGITAFVIQAAD
jgi:transmembrane sensor